MKKLIKEAKFWKGTMIGFVLMIALLCASISFGQTWHIANQITVGWDEVTTLANGDPIPAGDSIAYEIFLKNSETGEETYIDNTAETQYLFTLSDGDKYFTGVRTVRNIQGENDVIRSAISWSDNPAVCQNNENFGIMYYIPPGDTIGLRIQ